jgi:hypothetical protein
MNQRAALFGLIILASSEAISVAQEQFKKLSGPEIRAKFTGMDSPMKCTGAKSMGRMES